VIAVLARFPHRSDSGEIAIRAVNIFKIDPTQGCRIKFGKAIYKMPKLDLILGYGHRTTLGSEIVTEMAHELPFMNGGVPRESFPKDIAFSRFIFSRLFSSHCFFSKPWMMDGNSSGPYPK